MVRRGAITSLRNRSLRLRKNLKSEIVQMTPALFVARAPELHLLLSATGRTPSAAVNRLVAGIARQYILLAARPLRQQETLHVNVLRSMRRFIKEDQPVNESVSPGHQTKRKARIRRKP